MGLIAVNYDKLYVAVVENSDLIQKPEDQNDDVFEDMIGTLAGEPKDENIYRRNRAHLKESNELIPFEDNTRQLEEKKSDSAKTLCQEIVKDKPRRIKYLNHKGVEADNSRLTTRSGRVVKIQSYLKGL
ncbi:hypothetical protein LSH36_546g01025 [Paralvinella palmiformis]|uniref:Uncharacterized protein n=1 Tax=Paralvinella palmiformis TaxID=53620 RepID=A0AAD9J6X5_9ANNE|nr:hypothetical protein LSH36_546g01025 [Paralvinella palmiformis]